MNKFTKSERKLKVGYSFSVTGKTTYTQKEKTSPRILLQGDWLKAAGFEIGDIVYLKINSKSILISAEEGSPSNGGATLF